MPNLVVSGAMLRCSKGTSPSALAVTRGVNAGGHSVATVADSRPMVNIRPFGQCTSTANPASHVPSAGAIIPVPCVPITGPWTPGSPSVRAGTSPVLNHTCQCHCQWGGVVTILSPGQQTTTVA